WRDQRIIRRAKRQPQVAQGQAGVEQRHLNDPPSRQVDKDSFSRRATPEFVARLVDGGVARSLQRPACVLQVGQHRIFYRDTGLNSVPAGHGTGVVLWGNPEHLVDQARGREQMERCKQYGEHADKPTAEHKYRANHAARLASNGTATRPDNSSRSPVMALCARMPPAEAPRIHSPARTISETVPSKMR